MRQLAFYLESVTMKGSTEDLKTMSPEPPESEEWDIRLMLA